MKQKGAMFVLQADIGGTYTTLAAMRSTSMTINSETVEVTDKAFLFRELLENAGISSVSVKSSGVCSDDASYEFIKTKVLIGAVVDCKLLSNIEFTFRVLICYHQTDVTNLIITAQLELLDGIDALTLFKIFTNYTVVFGFPA